MNVLSVILAAELVLPIAEVTERPDRQESRYPGRVTPIAKVEVVPQVSGEIKAVQFANGQTVKTGDVLYRLDPVKYQAAVRNAESKLAECTANAKYAELSFERHKKLLETRAVALDAVDNALSQRDSSRAALAAAQAELVAAKDDLAHCTIISPISGKIGTTAKTEGNYVTAGSAPLVAIVQLDPIRVRFSVSNREALDMLADPQGGRRAPESVKVSLTLANGEDFGTDGRIEYVDNLADELTDTVTLYARFDNPQRRLVPGGTVAVTLASKVGVMRPAVPPSALLQDTQGPFAWVVSEDGRVERRAVARGDLVDGWLFVEKGLKVGEKVVADGAHRVRKTDRVKPLAK